MGTRHSSKGPDSNVVWPFPSTDSGGPIQIRKFITSQTWAIVFQGTSLCLQQAVLRAPRLHYTECHGCALLSIPTAHWELMASLWHLEKNVLSLLTPPLLKGINSFILKRHKMRLWLSGSGKVSGDHGQTEKKGSEPK